MAVISICRELKKKSPSTRIILGGPDATARGAAVLRDSRADILVRGEGELTFADLLSRLIEGKAWAGTPGTVSLSEGLPVEGPPRPVIKNLDIIPSPYLAGLFEGKKYRYMVLETSRGCPFKCSYCVWSNRGGVRNFSLERAGKEVDWLAARALPYNARMSEADLFCVFLSDQDLIMQGRRGRQMLRRIRSGSDRRHINWVIESDLRYWNKKTIAAANHETFHFGFGIQSLDRRVVRTTGRAPLPANELEKRLDLLISRAPKISMRFQLMLGLPGDSRKGFMKSLRWCMAACERIQSAGSDRLMRAGVQIFHTAVFPNTKLEKDAPKFGIKWSRRPPYLVKSMKGFTEKDLVGCYKEMRAIQDVNQAIEPRSASLIMLGAYGRVI